MNTSKLSLIGFLQALGVTVYCILISLLIKFLGVLFAPQPETLGPALLLILLVFSAAVTGSIVFGYSIYLALNKNIKDSLLLFVYTLLYCLGFFAIIAVILFI